MKLKLAFTKQNQLATLHFNALTQLRSNYFAEKTLIHLYDKVGIEKDNFIEIVPYEAKEFDYDLIKMIDFLKYIQECRYELALAIDKAKSEHSFKLDAEKSGNIIRSELINQLQVFINSAKNTKRNYNSEIYQKNVEGNQTRYLYNIEESIDYSQINKKEVKSIIKDLKAKNEEISLAIDEMIITTEVNYSDIFDPNDSVEDAYEKYVMQSN